MASEVLIAGADGTRYVSICPVSKGWSPVREGCECERKPGLPDMCRVACLAAEVPRVGADGMRFVLFLCNP